MKKRIDRIRKWLIVKLGGHVEPPLPVVRFDRVDVPIHKICVQATYGMHCPHSEIKHLVARDLAREICEAGLVEYSYAEHPYYAASDARVVKATIRVVEPQEGGYAE